MILFANNCVGSRIYSQEDQEFNHPFQWCIIKPNDMMYLIQNYKTIDWTNIKFIPRCKYWKNWTSCGLLVDGHIHLWFTHYRYDKRRDHRIGHNVYKVDIEKFIREKYMTRLYRFLEQNLDKARPIFLINCYNTMYNGKVMKRFVKLKGDFDIIAVTNDESLKKYNSPGFMVLCDEEYGKLPFIKEFAIKIRESVNFKV